MKEHIYTIPVTDAFREQAECPFCAMYATLEADEINFTLGPSYMEDDIRKRTNESGFCSDHFRKLFAGKNRLGLALMTQTHFARVQKEVSKILSGGGLKRGLFAKAESVPRLSNYSAKLNESCFVCEKIDSTFQRYVDTFFYLWKNNKEMKELFAQSAGFCLPHLAILYDNAAVKLDSRQCAEFTAAAAELQTANMKRLEEELDWFIKKFDYRYKDDPWNNSKDALPRVIMKLTSKLPE